MIVERKRICIIANSPEFNLACVRARFSESHLIIAADGVAIRLPDELAPSIICGDFDSLDESVARRRFPEAEFIRSSCQETNDLEKCIILAIARGASEVTLSCAMGGRPDQTVTTLSLLQKYHRELPITLYDGEQTCRVVSGDSLHEGRLDVVAREGDIVSLIPSGFGATVSLKNVQWPITHERLEAGSRGVSNKAIGNTTSLTVHEGSVFVFHSPPEE